MKKLFIAMLMLMSTGAVSAQTLDGFAKNGEVSAFGTDFNFAMQGELNAISRNALEASSGAGATGVAMGMLSDERDALVLGAGFYDGENAFSAGYNYTVSERTLARIAVSTNSVGNSAVGLSASYKFK